MGRRRYLVAYDISDPVRLRRVHEIVKGYGYWLQYSVFLCDLTEAEKVWLKGDLGETIHMVADRVAIVDLGEADRRGTDCFEFMGQTPELPRSGGPQII